MQAWEKRPVEAANLLNPPFCSLLLRDAIKGFQKEDAKGMPFPLMFLTLPLVLHKPSRIILPSTIRTKLHVWLQRKPEVRVGFSGRVRNLVPYTREGLIFGMRAGIINAAEDGKVVCTKKRLARKCWPSDSEPAECSQKAEFVGRWFAQAGGVSTIFAMWGICP